MNVLNVATVIMYLQPLTSAPCDLCHLTSAPCRKHFVFSCGRSSPICRVSCSARAAGPRVRIEQLARPKTTHKDYQPMRNVQTIIPKPALHGKATDRVENLASAKYRDEGPFREAQWNVSVLISLPSCSVRQGKVG